MSVDLSDLSPLLLQADGPLDLVVGVLVLVLVAVLRRWERDRDREVVRAVVREELRRLRGGPRA